MCAKGTRQWMVWIEPDKFESMLLVERQAQYVGRVSWGSPSVMWMRCLQGWTGIKTQVALGQSSSVRTRPGSRGVTGEEG